MTVLKSLLSSFRNSRNSTRKSRRAELVGQVTTEALEQRLLLTNPDPFDSNPGAAKTIYLDFDGHTENSNAWTGGAAAIVTPNFSADGDRTTFSDFDRTTIEEAVDRIKTKMNARITKENVRYAQDGIEQTPLLGDDFSRLLVLKAARAGVGEQEG